MRILSIGMVAFAALVMGRLANAAVINYGAPASTYSDNFDSLLNNAGGATPATDPAAGISTWSNGGASSTTTSIAGAYVFASTIAGATLSFQDGNPATGAGQGPRNFLGPDGIAPGSWTAMTAYYANATSGSKLFSFGATTNVPNSVNPATDRALGTVSGSATPSPGDTYAAIVLKNTTGQTLTQFILTYTSEKWRDILNTSTTAGNSATPDPTATAQGLLFSYKVASALSGGTDVATNTDIVTVPDTTSPYDANGDGNNGFGDYTRVPALDQTYSTLAGPATLTYVDGNLATNRATLSQTINTTWGDGQYLILRWFDNDETGGDIGLGIDDLSFSATGVPEPASVFLLGIAAPLLVLRRRSRRA